MRTILVTTPSGMSQPQAEADGGGGAIAPKACTLALISRGNP